MCISHYLQDIPIIHPFQYASSQRFQFPLSTHNHPHGCCQSCSLTRTLHNTIPLAAKSYSVLPTPPSQVGQVEIVFLRAPSSVHSSPRALGRGDL